jgi:hypothetical protein
MKIGVRALPGLSFGYFARRKQMMLPTTITRTQRAISKLAVVSIVAVLVAGCIVSPRQAAQPVPASSFQPLAEVNLGDQSRDGDTVGLFTLEETAVAGIRYTLKNVDTAYFMLSLVAADGTSYLILESEDYRTDENGGGFWQKDLAPGTYRLVLSAPQSPGAMSASWGIVVDSTAGQDS